MKTLDKVQISSKERDAVIEAVEYLRSQLPVSRVILFGSKARGTGDVYSDIDLLVLISGTVTSAIRAMVSDKLADLNLARDVGLSSIVVSEKDWSDGLIHYTAIHHEVERDGCEI